MAIPRQSPSRLHFGSGKVRRLRSKPFKDANPHNMGGFFASYKLGCGFGRERFLENREPCRLECCSRKFLSPQRWTLGRKRWLLRICHNGTVNRRFHEYFSTVIRVTWALAPCNRYFVASVTPVNYRKQSGFKNPRAGQSWLKTETSVSPKGSAGLGIAIATHDLLAKYCIGSLDYNSLGVCCLQTIFNNSEVIWFALNYTLDLLQIAT